MLKCHEFEFDRVFPTTATQADVYADTGRAIAASVLEGYNGTVLAYGQTASGKTYTMEGPDLESESAKGLIPRMCSQFFEARNMGKSATVSASVVEIYLERLQDLIEPKRNRKLTIREDAELGICIKGAAKRRVKSVEDITSLYRSCMHARQTAATAMNYTSSRSHCITIVEVKRFDVNRPGTCNVGKLYLVDLAGSEKVGKARLGGARLEETKKINKSLTMLGIVINQLSSQGAKVHVPYRDSKLTRILQESLGGNSQTALILCCSPSSLNCWETLSTLRFGCRAKRVKNAAKVNTQMSVSELTSRLEQSLRRNRELEMKLSQIEHTAHGSAK